METIRCLDFNLLLLQALSGCKTQKGSSKVDAPRPGEGSKSLLDPEVILPCLVWLLTICSAMIKPVTTGSDSYPSAYLPQVR